MLVFDQCWLVLLAVLAGLCLEDVGRYEGCNVWLLLFPRELFIHLSTGCCSTAATLAGASAGSASATAAVNATITSTSCAPESAGDMAAATAVIEDRLHTAADGGDAGASGAADWHVPWRRQPLRTETPELVDQCHLLSCPSVVSKYLLAALVNILGHCALNFPLFAHRLGGKQW